MFKIGINNESVFGVFRDCLKLFYSGRKREFYFLLLTTVTASIIDVASFTSVIPVIYLINNPEPIRSNPILHFMYTHGNFYSDGNFILFLLIGLAFIFIIKNLLLLACSYVQNKFIYAIAFDLTDRQFNRFFNMDYLSVKNFSTTEYIRFLGIAPQEFATHLLYPFTLFFYELVVVFLIVLGFLIYYPLILLLIIVSIGPLSYFMIKVPRKKLAHISKAKGSQEIQAYATAMEGINAYPDIKLSSKEKIFIKNIKDRFNLLYNLAIKLNMYQWGPRRIIETLVILTVCVLYAITSVYFNIYPAKVVVILLTFATAAYRLMPSVNEMLVDIVKIKSSRYVLQHLNAIPEMDTGNNTEKLSFSDSLECKNVFFQYVRNGAPVLTDINFKIKKGQFIVITGESGSGKSTLGKIIVGFIRPTSGEYKIDGKTVTDFKQINDIVGYVTQDFYLFDRSFLENIAIGEERSMIDMDRVYKSIKAANLTAFVNSFSAGLDYTIGEMGKKLSGGQKQRIAIARALYKQAQILVLDEITNSLDPENEIEILDTIYTIAKNENLTVIIITHRHFALKQYDARYEVEDGKLILKS